MCVCINREGGEKGKGKREEERVYSVCVCVLSITYDTSFIELTAKALT